MKFILIDLNLEYCAIAQKRLEAIPVRLDNILIPVSIDKIHANKDRPILDDEKIDKIGQDIHSAMKIKPETVAQ